MRACGAFCLSLAVLTGLIAVLLWQGWSFTDQPLPRHTGMAWGATITTIILAVLGAQMFGRIKTDPTLNRFSFDRPTALNRRPRRTKEKPLMPGEESLEDLKKVHAEQKEKSVASS